MEAGCRSAWIARRSMETNELYSLAEKHQHEVIPCKLHESPSFSVEENGRCYIAMSTELRGREEKTILAHELGHCEYGGFYNYHSPHSIRSKVEQKANRWAYIHVLPLPEISRAISEGNQSIWELAEYFGVTEQFMAEAITFYTEQLGQKI